MTEITIRRTDSRSFLQIGTESIEIADYDISSYTNGTTELSVTIIGNSNVFELSANLEEQGSKRVAKKSGFVKRCQRYMDAISDLKRKSASIV